MPPQSRRTFAATAVALPLLLSPLTTFSAHAAENPATPPSSPVPPTTSTGLLPADGGTQSPQSPTEDTRAGAEGRLVTVIVQLEKGTSGLPWYQRIFGASSETRHAAIKDAIAQAVRDLTHGQEESSDVTDYFHALDDAAGRMRPAASRRDIETV